MEVKHIVLLLHLVVMVEVRQADMVLLAETGDLHLIIVAIQALQQPQALTHRDGTRTQALGRVVTTTLHTVEAVAPEISLHPLGEVVR